jgi:hypothetical protein
MPNIKQLLHTPLPEPSSQATMFLCLQPKYLNEWWKSGSGEETPLKVAYSLPEMVDPIPSTATHVQPIYQSLEVTFSLTGLQACTKCIASWEIVCCAVVALRGLYGSF